MGSIPDSPLGKATVYPQAYDAGLLYSVERAPQRQTLGLVAALPFSGVDRWTAWEVAWLDRSGRPQAAIATFNVPCTSPRIVESKSVKLWLASFYNERFESQFALHETLVRDLSEATGTAVQVEVALPERWSAFARSELSGVPLDGVVPAALPPAPDASLLRFAGGDEREAFVTHTFRSLCPVTGQPDYASLIIQMHGPRIERTSLAAYLIGFRHHPGFHEHCVEKIFVDLLRASTPDRLAVEARFTRRGGIDINPFRTSDASLRASSAPSLRQ